MHLQCIGGRRSAGLIVLICSCTIYSMASYENTLIDSVWLLTVEVVVVVGVKDDGEEEDSSDT